MKSRPWSKKEIEFLKKFYNTKGLDYCCKKLKRSKYAVKTKASRLNIVDIQVKLWSKDEIKYLADNYFKGAKYVASRLNRSTDSVYKKTSTLGLKKVKSWINKDKIFLKENYYKGAKYVASRLNRSTISVKSQAGILGITKARDKYQFGKKELEDLYNKRLSIGKIACKYNTDSSTIRYHMIKLNIPRRKRSDAVMGKKNPFYGRKHDEGWKKNASETFAGRRNPNFGKPMSDEQKQKISKANSGKVRSEEFKVKISRMMKGENNPRYNGGTSREPYGIGFDENLREFIRVRDNRICQLCNINEDKQIEEINEKLSIHHINYDRKNHLDMNLISLCRSCHSKTNSNRSYWQEYFTRKINTKYKTLHEPFVVSILYQ